ncbi:GNAT family N-acetyltransferase [Hymenobacter weizhouensis]|uniref:GNAT family N-acetyltransferase n=1 Tax=Hymenobacter sp. YIM 151500-1 TaxID=2987689 RepID=UPI002227D57B|nr:GNAT family N-acetyltransferase [Hymenobacter sp. YIM 151500-1]UYZ63576.1 GNAT family N-acetyltransferase [Hymenobacter sp. YIM 151500-1]
MLHFLPYDPARHETAVRGLFRSNVPRYFVTAEEPDLLDYLASGHPYFVAVTEGEAVAAGGYALNGSHVALTWGMVHAGRHGQGIGRAFTEFRLLEAARQYPHLPIDIGTSQLTAAFYEKLGFRLLEPPQPNYWAPGLDRCRIRYDAHLTSSDS